MPKEQQTETPPKPSNKGAELENAEIRDNVEEHNPEADFMPLFPEEATLSEESLKGEEDDTAEKPADAEPKVETKPEDEEGVEKEGEDPDGGKEKEDAKPKEKDAKQDEVSGKEESKAEDAEKKEEPEKPSDEPKGKPPSGYVPKEALYQERQLNKTLKAEVARVSAELEKALVMNEEPGETDEFKDFKPLSNAEFDRLLEDDPDEATRYQYRFSRYQEHQRTMQERQLAEKRAVDANNMIIRESVNEMEKILPGVTTDKDQNVVQLIDFATEKGLHPEVLSVLTDPRTKLHTHDGRHLILGMGAPQLIGLIKSSFEAISNVPDEAELRKDIEKEVEARLRPEIEANVQKTIMEKIQSGSTDFRSLDQIPSAGKKETKPSGGILTEADYARMSEQERAQLLGS